MIQLVRQRKLKPFKVNLFHFSQMESTICHIHFAVVFDGLERTAIITLAQIKNTFGRHLVTFMSYTLKTWSEHVAHNTVNQLYNELSASRPDLHSGTHTQSHRMEWLRCVRYLFTFYVRTYRHMYERYDVQMTTCVQLIST